MTNQNQNNPTICTNCIYCKWQETYNCLNETVKKPDLMSFVDGIKIPQKTLCEEINTNGNCLLYKEITND